MKRHEGRQEIHPKRPPGNDSYRTHKITTSKRRLAAHIMVAESVTFERRLMRSGHSLLPQLKPLPQGKALATKEYHGEYVRSFSYPPGGPIILCCMGTGLRVNSEEVPYSAQGGSFAAKWVAAFAWNMRQAWSGIHIRGVTRGSRRYIQSDRD